MNGKLHNELYGRIALGDKEAFATVHNLYKARLLYFANRLVNNWVEAEDIVADAFLALWQYRQQLESDLHLKNFLFLAVRNKAADWNSTTNRRRKILDAAIQTNAFKEDVNDWMMIEEEMLHQLRQAVLSLPKECGRVFELSWQGEKSVAEIADLLGIAPATVRSQKRRAIQLIQNWIRTNVPYLILPLSIVCRHLFES